MFGSKKIKYITVMFFALTTLHISPSFGADFMAVSPKQNVRFKEVFFQWQKDQIANRQYMEEQDCNSSFYIDNFIEDKYPPNVDLGFPKKVDAIIPVFANSDDRLDFVAAFAAMQCDGGSANRGQIKILFLSNENGYKADTKFLSTNIKQSPEPAAFYRSALISSRDKTILIGEAIIGTYFDARCCPSLKSKFTFDFKTGETIFEDAIKGHW